MTAAQIDAEITAAAKHFQVPAAVLRALLQHESGLNPAQEHINSTGSIDRGIAQINSQAHPEVSNEQAYSPAFGIAWAAAELARLRQGCGSISGALQAYNSGRCNGAPKYAAAVLKLAGPAAAAPATHPAAAAGGEPTWLLAVRAGLLAVAALVLIAVLFRRR